MSKKIYILMLIGAAAGSALSVLLNYKNSNRNYDDESADENEMLDHANNFLMDARDKAEELVTDAEKKSDKIIKEAGKNLTLIKEKTSEMHSKIMQGYADEAMKIKNEMEKVISDFKNSLN